MNTACLPLRRTCGEGRGAAAIRAVDRARYLLRMEMAYLVIRLQAGRHPAGISNYATDHRKHPNYTAEAINIGLCRFSPRAQVMYIKGTILASNMRALRAS